MEDCDGDLSRADLSHALELDVDFTKYKMDGKTKLPVHAYAEVTYLLKKEYRDGKFHVIQQWYNKWGGVIKEYKHCFDYFCDFVAFLKGDLSDADLILCENLILLNDWTGINFTNAKMTSLLCEKFGLKYKKERFKKNLIASFEHIEKNEYETSL
jgi:hypothetical protein